MIQVFIADDYPVIRDAIKTYLKDEPEIKVVGEANNGKEVIEKLIDIEVDVLLLDYSMPEMDGLKVCEYVEEHFPNIKTIVISTYNDRSLIMKFIETGAVGYITKDASKDEYIDAIMNVAMFDSKGYSKSVKKIIGTPEKKFAPTKLELEVLELIVKGKGSKEIAQILNRAKTTIDERRKKMLERFKLYEGEELNTDSLIHILTKRGFL